MTYKQTISSRKHTERDPARRSQRILLFALLGLPGFIIFSIPALVLALKDLKKMAAGTLSSHDKTMLEFARTVSIVGMVVFIAWMITYYFGSWDEMFTLGDK